MSIQKLILSAIGTALLAGIGTLITWQMNGWPTVAGGLTYVTFTAWATYFLFGSKVKTGLIALSSTVAGIIGAILIFILSFCFGFSPWWAIPLAVFIVVIPMVLCEKVKPFRVVPAIFIGAGFYFSLSAAGAFPALVSGSVIGYTIPQYLLVGAAELIYVIIGYILGWLTVQLNTCLAAYKAKSAPAEPAAAVEPAASELAAAVSESVDAGPEQ